MPEIPRDIRFDHGIEYIIDVDHVAPNTLPDTTGYIPGDTAIPDRLQEILSPPTVEENILDSFRPTCHNRDLFTPTGFQMAHDRCQFELQTKLDKLRGTAEGDKVQKLMKFLDEKQDLTELLTTLRKLLQQV